MLGKGEAVSESTLMLSFLWIYCLKKQTLFFFLDTLNEWPAQGFQNRSFIVSVNGSFGLGRMF